MTELVRVPVVLVVEDHGDTRAMYAQVLELFGYVTHQARDGFEAWTKANELLPDVIVTDYRLPGINGAAFIKRFRGTHPDVRAMVISAYTDATTIDEATDAGATFMAKPLDFELLEHWVRGSSA